LTDTNYRELQAIYDRYSSQGFVVLGFPCNQFGGQEPGSSQDIIKFAGKYGVTFPMFEKIDVNGPNTHPLYKYLKEQKGELLGSDIKWNFGKFLVGREGQVLSRYAPTANPESIAGDIEKALNAQKGVVTPTAGVKAKAFGIF
jgi:glutathione peroxidase